MSHTPDRVEQFVAPPDNDGSFADLSESEKTDVSAGNLRTSGGPSSIPFGRILEMDPILANLQGVFQRVFDDDELVITNSTVASDVDGWDSMAHVNLMIAVEKQFGIRFTSGEIGRMSRTGQNVGNLVQLLAAKTGRIEGGCA
jgi:acyl carrier protein